MENLGGMNWHLLSGTVTGDGHKKHFEGIL